MSAALKYEPTPIEEAMPLAERFVRGVTEEAGNFDDCYMSNVEEVETVARSGFIPFTDGGYHGIAYGDMRYAHGSGCGPEEVKKDIESSIKDAEQEFERTHEISVAQIYEEQAAMVEKWESPQLPGIDRGPYPEHPMMETWYQFQDDWLSEGGTYFYKVKALFYEPENGRNELGDYEVRLFAYLNTDYEYGRDNISWLRAYGRDTDQTSGNWERTMAVAEFIALGEDGIDKLVEEAVDHLSSL